jgi:rsbT co-antagonist protein RsbR
MNEVSRRILTEILERHRDEIVDRATDWVREQAIDLGTKRPREETRRLVESVVATQATAILEGNDEPLDAFVEFVTTFRASSQFHVSTLLRGLASFRAGIEPTLRREVQDGWAACDIVLAIDRAAQVAMFRAADVYTDKLHQTVEKQREAVMSELALLVEAKERDLDEQARTIASQREMMNKLASPVIRVWEGVLVVPLIGELDPERADAVRERVLAEVVETKSRVVLVDITGLSVPDEQLASELLRIVGCVRLLGADARLVGVSPEGARALASLATRLDQIRSFSTLHDGLRDALRWGRGRAQTPAR